MNFTTRPFVEITILYDENAQCVGYTQKQNEKGKSETTRNFDLPNDCTTVSAEAQARRTAKEWIEANQHEPCKDQQIYLRFMPKERTTT